MARAFELSMANIEPFDEEDVDAWIDGLELSIDYIGPGTEEGGRIEGQHQGWTETSCKVIRALCGILAILAAEATEVWSHTSHINCSRYCIVPSPLARPRSTQRVIPLVGTSI
jgi:hypothetical protein